jgi:hypothetical protein
MDMVRPQSAAAMALLELRRRAHGLPLPSSLQAAAVAGTRIFPANPARSQLLALARCFCAVYGSAEPGLDGAPIWGEGWRCRYCAAETPTTASGPCVSCGTSLRDPVNELAEITRMLAQVLKPRADWHPVACVRERGEHVVGFAFGAVTTRQRAVEHLEKKLREYSTELALRGRHLDGIDLRAALPDKSPVFYMDELCVELGARDGIAALKGLAATLFAAAAELGARSLVGFTSRRAAPFPLIAQGGGELSIDLGELVVFRIADFLPIATLLHHLSADEVICLLAQAHGQTGRPAQTTE